MKRLVLPMLGFLLSSLVTLQGQSAAPKAEPGAPHAKVISFDAKGKKGQAILTGMPDSFKMRSGLIALAPGENVGKHSTKNNEELLVVLEGSGEMVFEGGSKLALSANSALYCPPDTGHDVVNTGSGVLRYVYVVSQAK